MAASVGNLVSLNIISINGISTLFLMTKGPMAQGNLISKDFLKFKKCSFSAMILFLIKSKAYTQRVKMAGNTKAYAQTYIDVSLCYVLIKASPQWRIARSLSSGVVL